MAAIPLIRFAQASLVLSLVLVVYSPRVDADIRLPKLISDHMVLQRDTTISLWGWADADETVTVYLNDVLVGESLPKNGRWQLALAAQKAGCGHQLTLQGKQRLDIIDVCFGDVWVASGQSNMEMPMARLTETYPDDLQQATYPQIRQFTVPQEYNFDAPQHDVSSGRWQLASPATIHDFSALAYYFARDLYQHNSVPIGILNNALGGSPIEAWLSEEALQAFPDALAEAKRFRDPALRARITADDQAKNARWYGDLQQRDPGLNPDNPWYAPHFDDSQWPTFTVPGFQTNAFTGSWWLRKTVMLSAEQANNADTLRLGSIVDADEVYINGQLIGNTTYQYPPRRYTVPTGVLQAGANLIAVRITSTQGKTGLMPDKPYWLGTDEQSIPLNGIWRMQTAARAEMLPGDTFIRWQPLGLFNGLMAPLTSLPIKGVIWYQGESNVGRYPEYAARFRALIRDWRTQWQQPELPFLYVQLANYLEKKSAPSDSHWAGLREAQRQVLDMPHTAMVVAIDTGEWNDIHPVDKKTLGQRLALAARAVVLNENLLYHGPQLQTMQAEGNALVLTFDHALQLKGEGQSFAIAGADNKFYWAQRELVSSTSSSHDPSQQAYQLRLSHPQVNAPTQVRYAWADNPDAVLYNTAGLPASPFTATLKPN